jgi:hypothetical protein
MHTPNRLSKWLLENASAPIRYRVVRDILDGGLEDPGVEKAREAVINFPAANRIISLQRDNGSWGNSIYAIAARKTGDVRRPYESTLYQLGRLIEYGFDSRDRPVAVCAEKVLLPSIKPDNNRLWELGYYTKNHPDLLPFLRALLRDIALRLLCPAGYADHPLVKDAVIRGLTEMAAFLNRAKQGSIYRQSRGRIVMPAEYFFPTHHLLRALGHTGWVHEVRQFRELLGLYIDFISENSPLPDYYLSDRGGTIRHGHEAAFHSKGFYLRYPSVMLQDLETLSRLGAVDRTGQGRWLLEELLIRQDGDGRFRFPTLTRRRTFDYYLLEPKLRGRDIDPSTIDATFRAALILHLTNYLI